MTLFACLTACGGGREAPRNASVAGEENVLNVYNWADYIGESTIRDFEARTGIKVTYDVYDSNEVLETKLMTGGSGYDVVVPSGTPTYKLLQAGALRKLDKVEAHEPDEYGSADHADRDAPSIRATSTPCRTSGARRASATTQTRSRKSSVPGPSTAFPRCSILRLRQNSRNVASRCSIRRQTYSLLAFIYLGLDPNSQRPEDWRRGRSVAQARPRPTSATSIRRSTSMISRAAKSACRLAGAARARRRRFAALRPTTPVDVVYVIPKEGAPSGST